MNLKEFKLQIFLLNYIKSITTPHYTTYKSPMFPFTPKIAITTISICIKGECYSFEDAQEALDKLMEFLP